MTYADVTAMPAPINSASDDFAFIIDKKPVLDNVLMEGVFACYFSSNRPGGKGKDDIWHAYERPLEFTMTGVNPGGADGIDKASICRRTALQYLLPARVLFCAGAVWVSGCHDERLSCEGDLLCQQTPVQTPCGLRLNSSSGWQRALQKKGLHDAGPKRLTDLRESWEIRSSWTGLSVRHCARCHPLAACHATARCRPWCACSGCNAAAG